MNEVCREHDGNNGYVVFNKDDMNVFSRHFEYLLHDTEIQATCYCTLTKLFSFCETRSSSPVEGDLFQYFFLLF